MFIEIDNIYYVFGDYSNKWGSKKFLLENGIIGIIFIGMFFIIFPVCIFYITYRHKNIS